MEVEALMLRMYSYVVLVVSRSDAVVLMGMFDASELNHLRFEVNFLHETSSEFETFELERL